MLYFLSLLLVAGQPPDSAGIYLTARDFQRHRLTYATTNDGLHRSFPGGLNVLKVRTPAGRQLRLAADSLYGYRKDGQDFRFIGPGDSPSKADAKRFMAVQAVTPLCVYSYATTIQYGTITYWFYSRRPDGPLRRLTVESLAKEFAGQPALVQALTHDKQLRHDIGARDPGGQLRVVAVLTSYLPPAPTN